VDGILEGQLVGPAMALDHDTPQAEQAGSVVAAWVNFFYADYLRPVKKSRRLIASIYSD